MAELNKTEKKLNIVSLTLGIVLAGIFIAVAYFYTPIINANTWKTNIENKIENHDKKFETVDKELESLRYSDRNAEKILIEMQFNLKNYLQSKGFPYIENPQINKKVNE